MSNKIKREVNKIEIPHELHKRSKAGILQAKKEQKRNGKRVNGKAVIAAAGLLVSIGTFSLFNSNLLENLSSPTSTETSSFEENTKITQGEGVEIPQIQLPENLSHTDMIGLIVYDGKVYTQTTTDIDPGAARALLGEKLGTTKGEIVERSKLEAYEEEFASTVGEADVYSVKGYDDDFRIMTYGKKDGEVYAGFYEKLNGITVYSGEDVFGELNMTGNVSSAEYRTYSDWFKGIDNYQPIKNMEAVKEFIKNLNDTIPYSRTEDSDPVADSRNNEEYRKLTIHLNDGSAVRLTLLKEGYIYYGFSNVYFKMDEQLFSDMWNQLQ